MAPRAVLTLRAGAEATRQVGELAMPVAVVARELSVCWWTVMNAVVLHGTPLVDDPKRVGTVTALGIDETSFLCGQAGALDHLRRRGWWTWVAARSSTWWKGTPHRTCADGVPARIRPSCAGIRVVATDLAESYRAGTAPHLDHAIRWPTNSMWCGWPTAASTRYAAGSQNETLGTGAGSTIPSIGSGSSCSKGPNGSTNEDMTVCSSDLRIGDPHDELPRCLAGQRIGP